MQPGCWRRRFALCRGWPGEFFECTVCFAEWLYRYLVGEEMEGPGSSASYPGPMQLQNLPVTPDERPPVCYGPPCGIWQKFAFDEVFSAIFRHIIGALVAYELRDWLGCPSEPVGGDCGRSSAACTTRHCGRRRHRGLRLSDCTIPDKGWGRIEVAETRPSAGKAWNASGEAHDRRGLKQRAEEKCGWYLFRPRSYESCGSIWRSSAWPRTGGSSRVSGATSLRHPRTPASGSRHESWRCCPRRRRQCWRAVIS